MGKRKALYYSSYEEMEKSEKGSETIRVLQKDLKLEKSVRISADK